MAWCEVRVMGDISIPYASDFFFQVDSEIASQTSRSTYPLNSFAKML